MTPIMVNFLHGKSRRMCYSDHQVSQRPNRNFGGLRCTSACQGTSMQGMSGGACRHRAGEVRAKGHPSWSAKGLGGASAQGSARGGEAVAGGEPRTISGDSTTGREEPGYREAASEWPQNPAAPGRDDCGAEGKTLYRLRYSVPAIRYAVRPSRSFGKGVLDWQRENQGVGVRLGGDRKVRCGMRELPHGTHPRTEVFSIVDGLWSQTP